MECRGADGDGYGAGEAAFVGVGVGWAAYGEGFDVVGGLGGWLAGAALGGT